MTAKRTAAQKVMGDGDLRFHYDHQPLQLPAEYHWQTTHNVAVDPENNLYVIHEGNADLRDHPSIFVFDPDGRFIKAFGSEFQGGGHGLEVRVEDGTPFLYVAAYQNVKAFAKLTLDGEAVWVRHAPMAAGVYAPGEATRPEKVWGRDRFMPTNFAFTDDGGFWLTDGYGSNLVHRYDADATYLSSFGGAGEGEGTFNTSHGIWIDTRHDDRPILVTDRAHGTIQIFDADGTYRRTFGDYGLPANFDIRGDQLLLPELVARVSILDRDYQTIATLGDDRERILADKRDAGSHTIRTDETKWVDGKFVHPHDACYDREGNIFVAEWVATGRVTKLTPA